MKYILKELYEENYFKYYKTMLPNEYGHNAILRMSKNKKDAFRFHKIECADGMRRIIKGCRGIVCYIEEVEE